MVIAPLATYEPKRSNKFFVEFPKEFNINPWFITSIDKPKLQGGKWADIKIEFLDFIYPSTSVGIFSLIESLNTKGSDSEYLFEFSINSTDPAGIKIEEWKILVEEVSVVDFGKLNHSNDDIQKPYMVIKPYSCILCY